MTIIEQETKFEEYRHFLCNEIRYLNSCYEIYKHLLHRQSDRLAEMNIAPAFFQITQFSLLGSIVIWIEKLLTNSSQVSIRKLLSFIEKNIEIFDLKRLEQRSGITDEANLVKMHITIETIKSDMDDISKLDTLKSIIKLRHKYFAHFDEKYMLDIHEINKDVPIKFSDIDDMISLSMGILRKYSSAYDGKYPSMEPSNTLDIDNILEIIHANSSE